jgi:hypothetical protein
MKQPLNNAIIGTLEGKVRDKIKEKNIQPTTYVQKVVLDQSYNKGGRRKSCNWKHKNKSRKKYVSNKNNSRNRKKNV